MPVRGALTNNIIIIYYLFFYIFFFCISVRCVFIVRKMMGLQTGFMTFSFQTDFLLCGFKQLLVFINSTHIVSRLREQNIHQQSNYIQMWLILIFHHSEAVSCWRCTTKKSKINATTKSESPNQVKQSHWMCFIHWKCCARKSSANTHLLYEYLNTSIEAKEWMVYCIWYTLWNNSCTSSELCVCVFGVCGILCVNKSLRQPATTDYLINLLPGFS